MTNIFREIEKLSPADGDLIIFKTRFTKNQARLNQAAAQLISARELLKQKGKDVAFIMLYGGEMVQILTREEYNKAQQEVENDVRTESSGNRETTGTTEGGAGGQQEVVGQPGSDGEKAQ